MLACDEKLTANPGRAPAGTPGAAVVEGAGTLADVPDDGSIGWPEETGCSPASGDSGPSGSSSSSDSESSLSDAIPAVEGLLSGESGLSRPSSSSSSSSSASGASVPSGAGALLALVACRRLRLGTIFTGAGRRSW